MCLWELLQAMKSFLYKSQAAREKGGDYDLGKNFC